jgi:hypothetical protein
MEGARSIKALYRWMNLDDAMIDALGKAAKLAWANGEAFAFHLDYDAAAQDDKTLVAVLMSMRHGVGPALDSVVVPDLQPLGLKADLIWRRVA